MLIVDRELIFYAVLTAVIETPLFYWCGYKKSKYLGAFLCVNIISNLLLNEALPAFTMTADYWLTLAFGEILVVLLEFFLIAYVIEQKRWQLFKIVCFTNVISLSAGLFFMFCI